jgi:hypothetical protein
MNRQVHAILPVPARHHIEISGIAAFEEIDRLARQTGGGRGWLVTRYRRLCPRTRRPDQEDAARKARRQSGTDQAKVSPKHCT